MDILAKAETSCYFLYLKRTFDVSVFLHYLEGRVVF